MAQHSLPYAAEQQIDHRVIDDKGETIVFEATILKEEIELRMRASYRANVGSILYCICYPCVKRQARNVAETWRLYVTEKTLCLYFVDRNLYGCSTPRVNIGGGGGCMPIYHLYFSLLPPMYMYVLQTKYEKVVLEPASLTLRVISVAAELPNLQFYCR